MKGRLKKPVKPLRNKCLAIIVAAVLYSSILTAVPVWAQDEGETASFNLYAYAPARVLVSYSYTNNYSITDISTVGMTQYVINSGPTSVEFQGRDVDIYTFTVRIRYALSVAQPVQVAVFSGSQAPQTLQINVDSDRIIIRFRLTVSTEPSYPSAEEVAEQVVQQISGQLTDFRYQTMDVLDVLRENTVTQWVVIGLVMVIAVATLAVLLLSIRPALEDLKRDRNVH